MTRRLWILLALFALLFVPSPGRTDEASKEDIAVLKGAGLSTDNKGLLAFLEKRTISEATRTKVAELIRQMGAEEYDEREKASKAVVEIGAPARPQLREALTDGELEVRRRARRALDK